MGRRGHSVRKFTKLSISTRHVLFGKSAGVSNAKLAVADFERHLFGARHLRARIDERPPSTLPDLLPFICRRTSLSRGRSRFLSDPSSPTNQLENLWRRNEFALPPVDEQQRITTVLKAMEEAGEAIVDADRTTQAMLGDRICQRLL